MIPFCLFAARDPRYGLLLPVLTQPTIACRCRRDFYGYKPSGVTSSALEERLEMVGCALTSEATEMETVILRSIEVGTMGTPQT